MDKKAKEAQLDAAQWKTMVTKVHRDKTEVWDTIKRIVFLHTIEPYKMYMRIEYDDGRKRIWEGGSLTEEGLREFPKCKVLAETEFLREMKPKKPRC